MTMREKMARAMIGDQRFDDPRTTDDNGINIITPREMALEYAGRALRVLETPTNEIIGIVMDALLNVQQVTTNEPLLSKDDALRCAYVAIATIGLRRDA